MSQDFLSPRFDLSAFPSVSLDEQLQQLLQLPVQSLDRSKALTQLIIAIQKSGNIGVGLGVEDQAEGYAIALQKTWLHFCQHPECYGRGVIEHFNQRLWVNLQCACFSTTAFNVPPALRVTIFEDRVS